MTLLWEGRQDKRRHPIPVRPPPSPPHRPAGLTGSKAGSSKRAAGHLRKNSSGVVKGRPRFRANCGQERKSAGGGGGRGGGRLLEVGRGGALTRRSAQEKSFFLRPGAQLAGRPAASGTEPGLHQHPWGHPCPPHQRPAPTTSSLAPGPYLPQRCCPRWRWTHPRWPGQGRGHTRGSKELTPTSVALTGPIRRFALSGLASETSATSHPLCPTILATRLFHKRPPEGARPHLARLWTPRSLMPLTRSAVATQASSLPENTPNSIHLKILALAVTRLFP